VLRPNLISDMCYSYKKPDLAWKQVENMPEKAMNSAKVNKRKNLIHYKGTKYNEFELNTPGLNLNPPFKSYLHL